VAPTLPSTIQFSKNAQGAICRIQDQYYRNSAPGIIVEGGVKDRVSHADLNDIDPAREPGAAGPASIFCIRSACLLAYCLIDHQANVTGRCGRQAETVSDRHVVWIRRRGEVPYEINQPLTHAVGLATCLTRGGAGARAREHGEERKRQRSTAHADLK